MNAIRSLLVAALLLTGCTTAPEQATTPRQALFGLGERTAEQLTASPPMPRPAADQVLLLAEPEVDRRLQLDEERVLESLTRALLAVRDGPQVLAWRNAMAGGGGNNQWRLESRLDANGPRLRLSDRDLLPYRLRLELHRAGSEVPAWRSEITGALDATAL